MIGAVLTGDIIHFTKMSSEVRTALVDQIEGYMRRLKKEYGLRYELYRGDSFQCLSKRPSDALRMALLIKTFIRGLNPSQLIDVGPKGKKKKVTAVTDWILDARIAIGIEEIAAGVRKLSTSDGMAFFYSGTLLDDIKNTRQHLAITSEDEYKDAWEIESLLLDALIRKTTALQCQVLNLKLDNHTEIEISNMLNIGQSAVNQRANTAEWHAIEEMVFRFERAYKDV